MRPVDRDSGEATQPSSTLQHPTIYDIARHTGFSPSTVSRALHKPGRINAKTEKVIQEAAKALGYRSNPFARALPTGKTGMLGLVVSDITNPVFFDLIRGAEQTAADHDRMLVLAETQMDPSLEVDRIERMLPAVEGFVLVASRLTEDQIRELSERRALVLANRLVSGVPCVLPDGEPGIREAITRLAELGHRSIAFLSGPAGSWVSAVRWEQLLTEAQTHGMTAVEIGPGSGTIDVPADALKRIVASGVTAVHTYNDVTAIGLIRACRAMGIDVPGRLSIVGHDDGFGADFTTPTVATIHSPMLEVGRHAMEQLIAALDGTEEPQDALYPTVFVPRESIGPAPART